MKPWKLNSVLLHLSKTKSPGCSIAWKGKITASTSPLPDLSQLDHLHLNFSYFRLSIGRELLQLCFCPSVCTNRSVNMLQTGQNLSEMRLKGFFYKYVSLVHRFLNFWIHVRYILLWGIWNLYLAYHTWPY